MAKNTRLVGLDMREGLEMMQLEVASLAAALAARFGERATSAITCVHLASFGRRDVLPRWRSVVRGSSDDRAFAGRRVNQSTPVKAWQNVTLSFDHTPRA
jgi:hypothetical protein